MTEKQDASIGAAFGAKMARKARQCWCLCLSLLVLGGPALAQTPTPDMPPASPEMEARLKKLETELRCLVCQNQTLAESPAGLAGDLRREVRLLADSGKSDEEIKAHLKARYGDFVLYKPQLENKTWVLWFGPFVLLMLGSGVLAWMARRRREPVAPATGGAAPLPVMSAADHARAAALLAEGGRIIDDSSGLRDLLARARVIAVVGLSARAERPSHDVAAYLQAHGYRIIPVNPAYTEILGEKCYARLQDVPEPIDIVDCFRKSADIPPVVEDAIAAGAKAVWMQLGIVNDAAARRATEAGLDVVMNRCTKIEHAALAGL
jgi:predicted CoA-binding protein/cytochrome c-type biogenesis protein CcmH/NrfF